MTEIIGTFRGVDISLNDLTQSGKEKLFLSACITEDVNFITIMISDPTFNRSYLHDASINLALSNGNLLTTILLKQHEPICHMHG